MTQEKDELVQLTRQYLEAFQDELRADALAPQGVRLCPPPPHDRMALYRRRLLSFVWICCGPWSCKILEGPRRRSRRTHVSAGASTGAVSCLVACAVGRIRRVWIREAQSNGSLDVRGLITGTDYPLDYFVLLLIARSWIFAGVVLGEAPALM